MKFVITFCLTLLMIPSLSLANGAQPSEKILVTLPPLSGLSAMLLPEIKSQCLLSAGADPHHFQPSPRQVDALNQGHILIRASRDDQGWPISTKNSLIVDLWTTENHGWLQFEQVRKVLPKLASALSKKFPQYQQKIKSRLAQTLENTFALEQSWDKMLNNLQSRGVFMQHPAWQNLLESKHVPVWAVLESHQHGHEHGPRHLEGALTTLQEHPEAILLGSKRHSNRSLEWLSNHLKHKKNILQLDALGRCNQPWNELMLKNLQMLSAQQ